MDSSRLVCVRPRGAAQIMTPRTRQRRVFMAVLVSGFLLSSKGESFRMQKAECGMQKKRLNTYRQLCPMIRSARCRPNRQAGSLPYGLGKADFLHQHQKTNPVAAPPRCAVAAT